MPGIKVCTMTQALADIHNFIQQMNRRFNFQNPKWITFGGSYPGTLSALFRQQYPADTVGAVASSAPLDWTLDFFGIIFLKISYDVTIFQNTQWSLRMC